MGGGGKGGSTSVQQPAPQYIDPVTGMSYSSSGALNAAIEARKAQEQAASEKAAAEAEAQRQADLASFNTRLGDAYNQSRSNAEQYFWGLGIDPAQYSGAITSALDTAKAKVPQLDPAPINVFGDNIGQQIVNSLQSQAQSRARTSLDTLFGGNYAAEELPLSLVDPVAIQVLNNQFDPLNSQLTNAQKRGTLNEFGYDAALQQLAKDRSAAESTVSRAGSNVIFADRGDIDSYLTQAYNNASNLPLAASHLFDPNAYYNEAESRTDRYRTNLYGDVLNALGDTKFSDIQRLLNAGGIVQGAYDPTATNPSGAVGPGGTPIGGGEVDPNYIAYQILQNSKRGLGSQGAF